MLGNLSLWAYFWIGFANAAYEFRRDPLGHPSGTGYTYWSHSIAVEESPFIYPFFKIAFIVNFPSFAAILLLGHALLPHEFSTSFFAGVSVDGWLLLLVIVVSFFQWSGIASLIHWLRRKWWPT
jgi:hypothetical protein